MPAPAPRVFLAALGAEETQIEASFQAAIRIAKEQKSISPGWLVLSPAPVQTQGIGRLRRQPKLRIRRSLTSTDQFVF